jgi:septum formation protein
MSAQHTIILASGSPRRVELLRQIGVAHRVHVADIDESRRPDEPPAAYVSRLAREKSERVWQRDAALPVLAADTAVVLDQELFGKPRDPSEGVRMLKALSGRTHRVYTAVALRQAAGVSEALSVSEVTFRVLGEQELARYWATGEPMGKAGGYAIQGFAASFITHLAGSYSGVMGLPLAETSALLSAAGVCLWTEETPP